ncbi:MAG: hypothetical protein KKH83_00310 [Candidatus Margulisbacteria bacterium]|nr:hypothetical protein [Candidatus Margulisiibacteriota bacterium]
MSKIKHPLAEIFGFAPTDQSDEAFRYRAKRLCPFNNKVPNCTKDKAKDPLGVCSIYFDDKPVITCPTRFRERWIITDDAAEFFFPKESKWTSLTEVRLSDEDGKSAGNIDIVLVSYDKNGKVCDFGALEIQAVYISGNIREPFASYMKDPKARANMDWTNEPNFPRPDYLSSSRKRLAPQLLFKGGILNSWNKKIAVALNRSFFNTLPHLHRVAKNKADIAWLLYDLVPHKNSYRLKKVDTIYTEFSPALISITTSKPGHINDFIKILQDKLDQQLETPPRNQTIDTPFCRR